MDHRARGWMVVALFVGSAAAASACSLGLVDTCAANETCVPPEGGSEGAQDAAARIEDSASGDTSDTAFCDPTLTPEASPCVLRDDDGIFVASAADVEAEADDEGGTDAADDDADAGEGGSDAARDAVPEASPGDGSLLRPYATIGQALANLGSKTRIYVCNGLYREQVTVTAPVNIYGGLDCATGPTGRVWSYAGQAAQILSPSPAYALSVVGVASGAVTVEDMSFQTPAASASGASSVAAMVASSTVNLVRVTLIAGWGADGAAGASGLAAPNYVGSAPVGGAQNYTDTNGLVVGVTGGEGATNMCTVFGSSAGGDGGLGCASGLGTPGTALPVPLLTAGSDGVPRGVAMADGGIALINDPGADGLAGDGGAAPSATLYGTLSSSGWAAQAGGDGSPGTPGQGGAGSTDPLYGGCGAPTSSVGGGGGGAGGCGGAGGKGGQGGGASLALAAVDATVSLQRCVLQSSTGGQGGAGGLGQNGQAGAVGGDVAVPIEPAHLAGEAGGNGAGGSGGAGGTGGISVGVLSKGGQVTFDMATAQSIALGLSGSGGAPGPAGHHATSGASASGSDGNPGAPGNPGTSTSFLQVP